LPPHPGVVGKPPSEVAGDQRRDLAPPTRARLPHEEAPVGDRADRDRRRLAVVAPETAAAGVWLISAGILQ